MSCGARRRTTMMMGVWSVVVCAGGVGGGRVAAWWCAVAAVVWEREAKRARTVRRHVMLIVADRAPRRDAPPAWCVSAGKGSGVVVMEGSERDATSRHAVFSWRQQKPRSARFART